MSKLYGRKRLQPTSTADEDASELKLGPEFQNEHCLLFSEVKFLLDRIQADTQLQSTTAAPATQQAEWTRHNIGPTFQKTLGYVSQICKVNNPETIKEMRSILDPQTTQLESFEIAQLANLLPEKSEEAKALVPSLMRVQDEDELQMVLDELQNFKRFQN